jgi:hypothetical protein
LDAKAAVSFAKWLAQDQPALFVELYKRAHVSLGDFTDVLSSIGTSLSDAVSGVGSFLTTGGGASAIAQLGGAYLQTQAARNAVNVNLARAQSGLPPAPIQTVFNQSTGQYEAVLQQPGGVMAPLTPTLQKTLVPGLPNWVLWAGGGVAVLLLLNLFRSGR